MGSGDRLDELDDAVQENALIAGAGLPRKV
jgi:hypothetical protein